MKKPSKELKDAANSGPQFMKARAIAARLGVCPKTIHRWAAAGNFAARKVTPRVMLFDLDEVLRFVESARVGGAESRV